MTDPSIPDRNAGWLVAAVCIAGPALVALIPMAAAPALIAMAKHFGASAESELFSQLVMTVPAAVLVVSAPIAGWLAGIIGQRNVLLGSFVLYTIGGAGVMLIESREALIGLRVILGIGGGGILTASLGLIGDHFSGHLREKLLGFATAASSLLAGLVLIFGGRLVDLAGWKAPFILYLAAVPVLLLAFAVIRDVVVASEKTIEHFNKARELWTAWPYFGLLILLTLGMFTPAIQVGFVLSKRGMGSAETIGTIIAVTSFVAMLSAWGFGYLRRWLGLHGFLLADALSMALGILTIGIAQETWQIFAGCVLVGIGAGMSEPAIASLLFRRLNPIVHAMAMGLIVSALNAGQFLNPLVFATFKNIGGLAGSFIAASILFFVASAIILAKGSKDIIETGETSER